MRFCGDIPEFLFPFLDMKVTFPYIYHNVHNVLVLRKDLSFITKRLGNARPCFTNPRQDPHNIIVAFCLHISVPKNNFYEQYQPANWNTLQIKVIQETLVFKRQDYLQLTERLYNAQYFRRHWSLKGVSHEN